MIIVLKEKIKWVLLIFALTTAFFAVRHFPHEVTLEIPGAKLPGNTGRIEGTRRIAEETKDKSGALTYGPYVKLLQGEYNVKLKYSATSDESGLWDIVFQGANSLIKNGKLAIKDSGWLSENITISKNDEGKALEIRIWYTEKGKLAVEKMVIKKVTHFPIFLALLEVLAAGTLFTVIFFLGINAEEKTHEVNVKNTLLLILLVFFLVLFYPFQFKAGALRSILNLVIIYLYLFFIGIGIYFLLTPAFLRKSFMLVYFPSGMGLLLLSIINVYVINLNKNIVNTFYLSLIVAVITSLLSIIMKKVTITSELEGLRQFSVETVKTFLIMFLFLLIILSPILKSNIPTTPYRIHPDHAGYAQCGQFLLSGGTLDKVKSDIFFQLGNNDLSYAVREHNSSLLFNSYINTEFFLQGFRQGYAGILAIFAMITGSDHVFNVQFLALVINYAMIAGFCFYLLYYQLNVSETISLLISFSVIFNANLINVYYEAQNVHVFFMPFLLLLLINIIHLRQKYHYEDVNQETYRLLFTSQSMQFIIFLGFTIAGVMNIYNEGLIFFFVFIGIILIIDIILVRRTNLAVLFFFAAAVIVSFILVAPHSYHWLEFMLGNFNKNINIAGFWQPHWASPVEILGVINMYVSDYTQNSPRLIERGELNYFINWTLSVGIFLLAMFYFRKKRNIDKSFWLASVVLVFIIFAKSALLDSRHNYAYMKSYSILLPLFSILAFMIFDFYSRASNQFLNRLMSSMKYAMVFIIIVNGFLYIKQYNQECKTVTSDMFKLYEYNAANNNIFYSYVFITNKITLDEIMIAPLFPFHWLNQGVYKYPKPHLEKKVALFITKKYFTDQLIFNKYKSQLLYENQSFFILDTNALLKESYNSIENQANPDYYIKQYKDLY